jgi:hypothetical protein
MLKEAIEAGQHTLLENPVNLPVIRRLLICYHVLEDKATAAQYAQLYFGLLNAIYNSGDGKSVKTAFVVITVSNEYEVLCDLELSRESQALMGTTDVLYLDMEEQKKAKLKPKIKALYFNVEKPLTYLRKSFSAD